MSSDPDICGVDKPEGKTSAKVDHGRLTMRLFGPGTNLDGTVGANGRVRASGIWRPPHAHFPQVTILNGTIDNDVLAGTASDFRCSTDITLHKTIPQPQIQQTKPHHPSKKTIHPKPKRNPHRGHSY